MTEVNFIGCITGRGNTEALLSLYFNELLLTLSLSDVPQAISVVQLREQQLLSVKQKNEEEKK